MSEQELKLKVQAMKESLGTAIGNYEERVADLRVELTVAHAQAKAESEKNEGLLTRIAELEQMITELREEDDKQETTEDADPS